MADPTPRSSEPKQRLGRGLAALLGDVVAHGSTEGAQGVRSVPIEFLRSNPNNPRTVFLEQELDELAESIREHGVIQPIIVRAISKLNNAYEIVAGERRWRAAQKAGHHNVPVITLDVGDREALEIAIVENVQRTDLNALEEAAGYARLAADYEYNHDEIARIVGKSRSHVANTIRLLGLPDHAKDLLGSGAISAGHARALLSMSDANSLADQIVEQGLTVRQVEQIAREIPQSGAAAKRSPVPKDANIQALEEQLMRTLGLEVEVRVRATTFEIRIKTRSLEQFNFMCESLQQIRPDV